MIQTKKILLVFLPAVLFVSIALFIRILQYEPLFPKLDEVDTVNEGTFVIPILPDDPILGNKKSARTIIAFEDFSCPACKQQDTTLTELLQQYPDSFKVIWKGLPVSEFPNPSQLAHEYAFCANQQNKFTLFKNYAFTNSTNLSHSTLTTIATEIGLEEKKLQTCLESEEVQTYIENNEGIARILNIQAVPTYFINNTQIKNPTSIDGWKTILNL